MDRTLQLLAHEYEVCSITEEELCELQNEREDELTNYRVLGFPDIILTMTRSEKALRLLSDYAKERLRGGKPVRIINSPEGIALCNHRNELERLARENGIPMPLEEGTDGVWLKRGEGTAEVPEDTVFCQSAEEETAAMAAFHARGIDKIVRQAHVVGDLIKFYGIGDTEFFHTMYPTDTGRSKFGSESHNGIAHHYAYDIAKLKHTADRLAALIDVKVYGGDAIVREDGTFVIIDFNDWPTFSPCRDEAAKKIVELTN